MPNDILRDGGEAAVARALAWLTNRSPDALEHHVLPGVRAAAFNITILRQLLGTALQPDLAGHGRMREAVSEQQIGGAPCRARGLTYWSTWLDPVPLIQNHSYYSPLHLL